MLIERNNTTSFRHFFDNGINPDASLFIGGQKIRYSVFFRGGVNPTAENLTIRQARKLSASLLRDADDYTIIQGFVRDSGYIWYEEKFRFGYYYNWSKKYFSNGGKDVALPFLYRSKEFEFEILQHPIHGSPFPYVLKKEGISPMDL